MDKLIQYALSFVGTHYVYGGETPQGGMDCSGLVQEILRSVGCDPYGDQSAQMLFNHFVKQGVGCGPAAGAIAFYGANETSISHIAFCIDSHRVVESGGGTRNTISIATSIDHKAFVRVRPVTHRQDFYSCIMPGYPDWILND